MHKSPKVIELKTLLLDEKKKIIHNCPQIAQTSDWLSKDMLFSLKSNTNRFFSSKAQLIVIDKR